MTTALVTGITGQDGSYLAERLLAEGVEVHGVVQGEVASPDRDGGGGPVLHSGDVRDPDLFARLLAEVEPDEVYNLAGITSVALSWREPRMTAEVTGSAVAALLHAVVRHQEGTGRPVRLLQASSAEIFGRAEEAPQTERTPIRPSSPYGAAKAFAHHLVGVYRATGVHASTVILYNHESPRRPETFVTRKITRGAAAIAQGTASELVLGNLDARRDWGWAPDYVDAMVRAARHDAPGDYVVATGVSHTVADFVAAAFRRVGLADWRAHVRSDPALGRPGDAALQVGDASLAATVLGWSPTVGFDDVVGRMVEADLATS